jgi:hypothetical protein
MPCDDVQPSAWYQSQGFGQRQLQRVFVGVPFLVASLAENDDSFGRVLPRIAVTFVKHVVDMEERLV